MLEHPQPVRPVEHATYNPEKMGKSTLFESPRMLVGLNAFEPGQEHKLHAHAGMDKVYQVLEGDGLLLRDDREDEIQTGMTVVVPDGVPHGIRNTGSKRLLILAILAPGPKTRQPPWRFPARIGREPAR